MFADEHSSPLPRFHPPADFEHPPELLSPAPRPVPGHVRNGPWMRMWRRGLLLAFLGSTGVTALYVLAAPPFLKSVPVAIAIPIVGTLVALGSALTALVRLTGPGRMAYVRDGHPITGRVLDTSIYWFDPQAPRFGYRLEVEYADPASGEIVTAVLESGLIGGKERLDEYVLSVGRGDYITLVTHRDRYDHPLQAYGFTGLNEQYELIHTRRGLSRYDATIRRGIVEGAGLIGLFGFVFFTWFHTLEHWWPMAEHEREVLIAGAAVAAVCTLGWFSFYRRRQAPGDRVGIFHGAALAIKETAKLFGRHLLGNYLVGDESSASWRRAKPFVMSFLFGTAGGFILGCIGLTALNAALDFSRPQERPVMIVELRQDRIFTLRGSMKSTKISYRDPASGMDGLVNLQRLSGPHPAQGDEAILMVQQGLFGWRWIQEIRTTPDSVR